MIRFTYKYDEVGYATSQISDGVNSLDMYPSRFFGGTNLRDLAERVVALLKAGREGISVKLSCGWDAEPGQYRWVLENESSKLRITILWFDESWSDLRDEKGEVIFSTECFLLKFAIQVKTALREALETLGPDEYRKRTKRDFPQAIYNELKSLIRDEQLALKATAGEKRQR